MQWEWHSLRRGVDVSFAAAVMGEGKGPSGCNQPCVATVGSPGRTERLGRIAVPTLVIHGQNDPCLPVEHGIALAKAITGAKLIVTPDMGHLLPPSLTKQMAGMVLENIHRISASEP